ncbi:hypothetical protein FH972_025947 [Carpinus fangiana]|uniref:Uncharacterized protein n=1 Tax=Carpinus fangiana TaxID=176857 RepID=A0A5N6L2K8_9ROSI|nr:hypothetical protein FH972_025947 [Carpinus fangiana]
MSVYSHDALLHDVRGCSKHAARGKLTAHYTGPLDEQKRRQNRAIMVRAPAMQCTRSLRRCTIGYDRQACTISTVSDRVKWSKSRATKDNGTPRMPAPASYPNWPCPSCLTSSILSTQRTIRHRGGQKPIDAQRPLNIMSSDDQHFLDILASLPSEISERVEHATDKLAITLRHFVHNTGDAFGLRRAPPPPPRIVVSPALGLGVLGRTQAWIVEHRTFAAACVAFFGTGGLLLYRQRRAYMRKRRAKRALNGARQEVVDLERRGFIVYVVCGTPSEEQAVKGEGKTDIIPLYLNVADPFDAQNTMEHFKNILNNPQYASAGATPHKLSFTGLVLIPDVTYPAGPIETLSPELWSDALNAKVLGTVATSQAFLQTVSDMKARVLVLTPGIVPALRPAFHGVESTVVGALDGFTGSLRSELATLGVDVVQLKMGTFDTSSVGDRQALTRDWRADILSWAAHARSAYAENYLSQREEGQGVGLLTKRQNSRGSPLRELNNAIFDALTQKRPWAVRRVGRGSLTYDLIGSALPSGLPTLDALPRPPTSLTPHRAGPCSCSPVAAADATTRTQTTHGPASKPLSDDSFYVTSRLKHTAPDPLLRSRPRWIPHAAGPITLTSTSDPLTPIAWGRMLARKFEEENDGRRISRLPHLTVANEFGRTRNGYPASPPTGAKDDNAEATPDSGTAPEMTLPQFRPQSYYPAIQSLDEANRQSMALSNGNPLDTVSEHPERSNSIIDTARSQSPDAIPEEPEAEQQAANFHAVTTDTTKRPFMPQKKPTNESDKSTNSATLAPPKSPAFPRSPRLPPAHLRSARMDNSDDTDNLSVNGDPGDSRRGDRKLSVSSGHSRPRSPFSPVFAPPRSPSMSSEYSTTDRLFPRQSQNFSRPMSPRPRPLADSRDGRSSVEQTRNLAPESPRLRPSFDNISINESIDSPMFPPSHMVEAEEQHALGPNGVPSYIYAKYSLPRGRVVSRESMSAQDFLTHKFEWQQPFFESNVEKLGGEPVLAPPPPSLPTEKPGRPSAETTGRAPRFTEALDDLDPPTAKEPTLPQLESLFDPHSHILSTVPAKTGSTERPKTSSGAPAKSLRSHKSNPSFPPPNLSTSSPFRTLQSQALSRSKDDFTVVPSLDASHLRDELQKATPPSTDQITAEDHLTKGIACHENGQLQKSTYHLRLAAKAGHPTAMLLYALAARHGWGMRPNQAEGVAWLRKAVDLSGLEVADDETASAAFARASQMAGPDVEQNAKGAADGPLEAIARRSHKAQLALSIYELGVSYMNGWGVAQDKALALRCFEIAGGWGDGDALAEAGFCYAKGVGCKKDMNKAAGLYRAAEAKGIGMAGNSWYAIFILDLMPGSAANQPSHTGSTKTSTCRRRQVDQARTLLTSGRAGAVGAGRRRRRRRRTRRRNPATRAGRVPSLEGGERRWCVKRMSVWHLTEETPNN